MSGYNLSRYLFVFSVVDALAKTRFDHLNWLFYSNHLP